MILIKTNNDVLYKNIFLDKEDIDDIYAFSINHKTGIIKYYSFIYPIYEDVITPNFVSDIYSDKSFINKIKQDRKDYFEDRKLEPELFQIGIEVIGKANEFRLIDTSPVFIFSNFVVSSLYQLKLFIALYNLTHRDQITFRYAPNLTDLSNIDKYYYSYVFHTCSYDFPKHRKPKIVKTIASMFRHHPDNIYDEKIHFKVSDKIIDLEKMIEYDKIKIHCLKKNLVDFDTSIIKKDALDKGLQKIKSKWKYIYNETEALSF